MQNAAMMLAGLRLSVNDRQKFESRREGRSGRNISRPGLTSWGRFRVGRGEIAGLQFPSGAAPAGEEGLAEAFPGAFELGAAQAGEAAQGAIASAQSAMSDASSAAAQAAQGAVGAAQSAAEGAAAAMGSAAESLGNLFG